MITARLSSEYTAAETMETSLRFIIAKKPIKLIGLLLAENTAMMLSIRLLRDIESDIQPKILPFSDPGEPPDSSLQVALR